jgi:acetylornithine/succinyldiaminopimelate/putrescine aminotransferase
VAPGTLIAASNDTWEHAMTKTRAQAPRGAIEKLAVLRARPGARRTQGLPDAVLQRFLARDPSLQTAIERALERYREVAEEMADLLAADEDEQVRSAQAGIVNFYGEDLRNPYLPLGAAGPWIVTAKGAVVHDSGGYGMLGFGHAPAAILEALARPQVMANVMTASLSQRRLLDALRREIGHRRAGGCPFSGFLFLNSGSESVTMAARLVDVNAKRMTDPGGRHAGRPIRRMALGGGFHGRTQRPAMYSGSGYATYCAHLATFRDAPPLIAIEPNDVEGLRSAFAAAEAAGEFVEALFLEPVMGEGNPGLAITRPFYDAARALTAEHGALLLADSIQAGLRAHGVLSIVDYPGFEDCLPPDMETYSKSLNAGQYPLSVLAMTSRAASLLVRGIYGNTMTAAPRAMDVATAVLASVTPALRRNIVDRGRELVAMLERLRARTDGAITKVQGTGLLVSCALDPARYTSHGEGSTEEYLRTKGFGVIHGGKNALRYTPHFAVTTEELELIVDSVRDALAHGPRKT